MSESSAPEGWRLVPDNPTVSMWVDGFEAVSAFQDTDEYRDMAGCKRAAESAKICYAAMLAACPVLSATAYDEAQPVGEVYNKYGDPEAFAEKGFTPYASLFKLPSGTKVYAMPPVTDDLLVQLFYAAQGDITQFRINARKLLAA